MIVLKILDSLILLMTVADRMGINMGAVQNTFNKAKAEGRDVSPEEVKAMALTADMSKSEAQAVIDAMDDD